MQGSKFSSWKEDHLSLATETATVHSSLKIFVALSVSPNGIVYLKWIKMRLRGHKNDASESRSIS